MSRDVDSDRAWMLFALRMSKAQKLADVTDAAAITIARASIRMVRAFTYAAVQERLYSDDEPCPTCGDDIIECACIGGAS